MDEIWKDIDNTSGRYQISSNGRFRKKEKEEYYIVKPHLDSYGYQYVCIRFDNNTKKHVAIHRLVAMAFINNPYNLPIVHHIDDNKLNNCVSNLFWCTYAQNNSFRLTANNGRGNSHRVIEQYSLDGKLIATWSSFEEAYRSLNLKNTKATNLISKCCRRKEGRKQAYGYLWKFGMNDPQYKSFVKNYNEELDELFRLACQKSAEEVKEALLRILSE